MPVAFWKMLFCLVLNTAFLLISYRPMKKLLFEGEEAGQMSKSQRRLHYTLLFCIVITSISSFDTVGGILTISLFVAPIAVARLYSRNLRDCILYSIAFALLHAVLALILSFRFNISLSGCCAFVGMLDGLVQQYLKKAKRKGAAIPIKAK